MSIAYKRLLGIVLVLAALFTVGCEAAFMRNSLTSAPALPTPQVRNFTLYVRPAQMTMPDGKKIWAFGYTDNPKGQASIPGPTIVVNEGDTVNMTLNNDQDPTKTKVNTEGDGHTIHFHGLDLPSEMDGDPMVASEGLPVLPQTKFTYRFVAKQPGTYWYHCHQGAAEHIQMGMYGAMIVRPRADQQRAYMGTDRFDKEYTLVLSDIDSDLHSKDYDALHKEGGAEPNWSRYQPNYFLVNGKAWPDTLSDKATTIEGTIGQTLLVRLVNAGYTMHAIHTHGFHFKVIGSDGRKFDAPYYKDTIALAPGERYDILLKLDQVGRYMLHDHFEHYTTNDGAANGGMVTLINVNNKNGSNPIPIEQILKHHGHEE